jgi:transcriptional regulator with XRE-family HTH domain
MDRMTRPAHPSRLAQELARRGMQHQALAAAVGLSPGSISHFSTGRRRPTVEVADRIARLLDVPTEQLFPKAEP